MYTNKVPSDSYFFIDTIWKGEFSHIVPCRGYNLNAQLQFNESILGSIATGVITLDPLGEVDSINQAGMNILKKNSDETIGNHYMYLFEKDMDVIGLIQMTRQRVRAEMEIKTIEANPNQNGTVEAPIVLIDKIYDKLEKVFSSKKYNNVKVFLHVHPFVAAYLKSEYPSLRMKWYLKHKRWVTVVPRDAYTYLHFRFFSKEGKIINA